MGRAQVRGASRQGFTVPQMCTARNSSGVPGGRGAGGCSSSYLRLLCIRRTYLQRGQRMRTSPLEFSRHSQHAWCRRRENPSMRGSFPAPCVSVCLCLSHLSLSPSPHLSLFLSPLPVSLSPSLPCYPHPSLTPRDSLGTHSWQEGDIPGDARFPSPFTEAAERGGPRS